MATQSVETSPSPELPTPTSTPGLPPLDINAAATQDARPIITRAVTEPASPSSSSLSLAKLSIDPTPRQRNSSPYARHLRSRSSASTTSAPAMTRAHSSPAADSFDPTYPSSPFGRPSSPLYSSRRRVSPLRHALEESSFSGLDIDQTISEHDELDIKPRPSPAFEPVPGSTPPTPSLSFTQSGTFPRTRRIQASPLQHLLPSPLNLQQSLKSRATLKMSSSTPALRSAASPLSSPKYNESYPKPSHYAQSLSTTSSMPSTPTSFRSRSPSISSLETIPDSPDAEEAAIEEAERDKDAIAKLKAAIEREGSRRGSFEGARGRGMFKDLGSGQDKRKRWSVCGAERRGDLDLETIWED
ncbi:MAG: hypothetical protein LQ340_007266 [Diploschistes diacapsis]|nr:MAG: hypothetical protein LQ340_007266 [Diploschistes diacapsis]